jgi:DNA repair protein RadC
MLGAPTSASRVVLESSRPGFLVSQAPVKKPKNPFHWRTRPTKIERANRRTDKAQVREYRFREAQLIVRDNPSLPVEIEALAGVQFNSSEVVARALRNLVHMDQETFIALHLNGRLKVSALTVVSIGTISTSLVHPREVFRSAILAGATGIIGVHNHPSGDPAPSHEDRAITTRLAETGRIIGIRLFDHIIIGKNRHFSFADEGLL